MKTVSFKFSHVSEYYSGFALAYGNILYNSICRLLLTHLIKSIIFKDQIGGLIYGAQLFLLLV